MRRASWSCRDRCQRLCSRREFLLDAREQVVDVVALEDAIAQCAQDVAVARRVPAGGEVFQVALVRFAPGFDWFPRALGARAQAVSRRTTGAGVANLVELLVEREDFFEQRWRDFVSRFLLRSLIDASFGGQAFQLE